MSIRLILQRIMSCGPEMARATSAIRRVPEAAPQPKRGYDGLKERLPSSAAHIERMRLDNIATEEQRRMSTLS